MSKRVSTYMATAGIARGHRVSLGHVGGGIVVWSVSTSPEPGGRCRGFKRALAAASASLGTTSSAAAWVPLPSGRVAPAIDKRAES